MGYSVNILFKELCSFECDNKIKSDWIVEEYIKLLDEYECIVNKLYQIFLKFKVLRFVDLDKIDENKITETINKLPSKYKYESNKLKDRLIYINNLTKEIDKELDETDAFKNSLNITDFAGFVPILEKDKNLQRNTDIHLEIYHSIMENLFDGETALLVGHGYVLEYTVIRALKNIDFSTWGKLLSCGEGVLLSYDNGKFIAGEVLRIK